MTLSEKELFKDFIKCDPKQELYVMKAGENYISCLGFQYAFNMADAICKHYGTLQPRPAAIGTPTGYAQYVWAVEYARVEHERTGLICPVALSKQLIGLEGKRVEVITMYDEKRRFKVGRSTGFIPCHLELANTRSKGGGSAEREYKSVKVIR